MVLLLLLGCLGHVVGSAAPRSTGSNCGKLGAAFRGYRQQHIAGGSQARASRGGAGSGSSSTQTKGKTSSTEAKSLSTTPWHVGGRWRCRFGRVCRPGAVLFRGFRSRRDLPDPGIFWPARCRRRRYYHPRRRADGDRSVPPRLCALRGELIGVLLASKIDAFAIYLVGNRRFVLVADPPTA